VKHVSILPAFVFFKIPTCLDPVGVFHTGQAETVLHLQVANMAYSLNQMVELICGISIRGIENSSERKRK
jgi:hypothetical protein